MFFCQVSINGVRLVGEKCLQFLRNLSIGLYHGLCPFFSCVFSPVFCLDHMPIFLVKVLYFRDSVNICVLKSSLKCRELLHCCLVFIKDWYPSTQGGWRQQIQEQTWLGQPVQTSWWCHEPSCCHRHQLQSRHCRRILPRRKHRPRKWFHEEVGNDN